MPIDINTDKNASTAVNNTVDKMSGTARAQQMRHDAYMDFLKTVQEISDTFKFTDLQWTAIQHLLEVHAGYIDAGWELKIAPVFESLSNISDLD